MLPGRIPARWQNKLIEIASKNGIALSPSDFIESSTSSNTEINSDAEIFAKHKGELHLGDKVIDCYVLSNGERVINMRSAVLAIAKVESGNLGEYIGIESLKPFIDKDKILGESYTFSIPGTQ